MARSSDELLVISTTSIGIRSRRAIAWAFFRVGSHTRYSGRVYSGIDGGFDAGKTNQFKIFRHHSSDQKDGPKVLQQFIAIKLSADGEAFLIQRSKYRNASHQRRPNGVVEVVKTIGKLTGQRKFYGREPAEYCCSINFIDYKVSSCKTTTELLKDFGKCLLVVRHFSVYLNQYKHLFSLITFFLPLRFISSDLYRSVTGAVGCAPQAIGDYPQYYCGYDRAYRPKSSDRIPPHHAVVDSELLASENAVPFTHSMTPLWIGRHSVTGARTRGESITLATIKPPRNGRTKLREDA